MYSLAFDAALGSAPTVAVDAMTQRATSRPKDFVLLTGSPPFTRRAMDPGPAGREHSRVSDRLSGRWHVACEMPHCGGHNVSSVGDRCAPLLDRRPRVDGADRSHRRPGRA